MYPTIGQWLILTLCVSAISLTLAKTHAFAWWRVWMRRRSEFLGELADCHYCMSHWVSLAVVAIYRPIVVESQVPTIDLAVSLFAIVACAALVSGVISFLMRGFHYPAHELDE